MGRVVPATGERRVQREEVADHYKGRPLPLSDAVRITCDVSRGLTYAHQAGYLHRDIKPANILLTLKNVAKLSDFGLSAHVTSGGHGSLCGYVTHLAPEVYQNVSTSALTDVYALGITAYRLVNGDAFMPSFADDSELQDLVLTGGYPDRARYRPYVPVALKRVINRAINVDASRRFSCAAEFRFALEQISICCDWIWSPRGRTVRYRAKIGNATVYVNVDKSGRRCSLETSKRIDGGQRRRVTKDCFDELTLSDMRRHLRAILARYVSIGR